MGKTLRMMRRRAPTINRLRKGEGEKGVTQGEKRDLSKKDLPSWLQLGRSSMEEGHIYKAIALWEEVIKVDPGCEEAYLNLGRCYEKLKRYEKAIPCYERALECNPSHIETRYSLAVALQLLGLHRDAEKEYLEVLAADDSHLMARNNLAVVYLKEGKRDEAISEFMKLVVMDPHNPTFQDNLTIASCGKLSKEKKTKHTKQGISLCMIVSDEGEEIREFFTLVTPWVDEIIVVDTGVSREVIEVVKEFGAKVVYHPWEDDFSRVRNRSLAEASYEWIVVLDADEYMTKEGLSYLRVLTTSEEYQGFRFIQRNYRDNPSLSGWVPCTDNIKQIWNCCGWVPTYPVKLFRNHGEIFFEGMVGESVEKSISRRGGTIGNSTILIHHVDYFIAPEKRIARETMLLELGEKQLKLTPDDPGVYYEVALRYGQLNKLNQAVSAFTHLAQVVPRSYRVHNELGNIYCAQQDYHAAQDSYLHSLRLEPRFFQAHYNLANLHLLMGKLDEAWGVYQQALALSPECAPIYNNLAIICERRGEDDEALTHCEHAISLNPFLPQAYNNLGVLYSKKGERRRAEESFLRAIRLHAGYAEAYVNLGNLYLSEGKKGEAERIVAHARRCAPEVGGENKGCNL